MSCRVRVDEVATRTGSLHWARGVRSRVEAFHVLASKATSSNRLTLTISRQTSQAAGGVLREISHINGLGAGLDTERASTGIADESECWESWLSHAWRQVQAWTRGGVLRGGMGNRPASLVIAEGCCR